MSFEHAQSSVTRPRDATTTITVRFTDSIADADPPLGSLHELDATLAFPSLTRAYAFENRLNRADDARTYQLTPDHDGDATLFLRCEESRTDRRA